MLTITKVKVGIDTIYEKVYYDIKDKIKNSIIIFKKRR